MFMYATYTGAIRKEKGFRIMSEYDKITSVAKAYYGVDRTFMVNLLTKYNIDDIYRTFVRKIIDESGCQHIKRIYSKGQDKIKNFLDSHNVQYKCEYLIKDSLFRNPLIKVDFYIPKNNTFIEFNGRQHYKPEQFGADKYQAEEFFERQKRRDDDLHLYCFSRGITLIEIPYTEFDNIDAILSKYFHN